MGVNSVLQRIVLVLQYPCLVMLLAGLSLAVMSLINIPISDTTLVAVLAIVAVALSAFGVFYVNHPDYKKERIGILALVAGLFFTFLSMWLFIGGMEVAATSRAEIDEELRFMEISCIVWTIMVLIHLLYFILRTKEHNNSAEVLTGDFNNDLERILDGIRKYDEEYAKIPKSDRKRSEGGETSV